MWGIGQKLQCVPLRDWSWLGDLGSRTQTAVSPSPAPHPHNLLPTSYGWHVPTGHRTSRWWQTIFPIWRNCSYFFLCFWTYIWYFVHNCIKSVEISTINFELYITILHYKIGNSWDWRKTLIYPWIRVSHVPLYIQSGCLTLGEI